MIKFKNLFSKNSVQSSKLPCIASKFQLKRTLDELEVLKCEKMEQFIKATRVELTELWDRCYYSQHQRDKFAPFFSTDYNEDLLNEHEAEVEALQTYYNDNRELFHMVIYVKFINL